MSFLKGFRTFIVNAALATLPFLEIIGQLLNIPELRGLIPLEYAPWYALGTALINFYLRTITTSPPGQN